MTLTVTPDELRKDFNALLEKVELGDELHVVKESTPQTTNRTVLGMYRDSIKVLGSLECPIIPEEDWNCLREDFDPTK